MSIRSATSDVDVINWDLTQATNWRNGLRRLAHTLAEAGVAGTGILDTEAGSWNERAPIASARLSVRPCFRVR
ncbi:DUF5631 domain-containing protein [[Mycobacterium] burgundiense]|uniref:DUF5631 domain-containing protein n=1 Tax=[Mycobacterium] burgundiense TaxID=3064286 RepID=A0ABM9M3H5_9MYCO|nr:DUF5631 domain-containing protein [Mycolicibacterium sp. MU0053]CAJ1509587.1 DUF5631 domain-containing protein [Mycolicibacterium sp. MU0053]